MIKKWYGILILLLLLGGAGLAWGQQDALPPAVLGVQPYPGEEMPLDSSLTIVFNQAMERESVEQAWRIAPDIAGTFEWADDRTMIFRPADSWARDTAYTISIGESAAAQNGLGLPEAYSFTARSLGALEVASVIPAPDTEGIAADATITVAFNRPVIALGSSDMLEDAPQPLQFDPPVEGTGEWVNTSIYQFTPKEALLGGATYTVTIPAGLTDFSGAALAEDYSWTFHTLVPEILWTTPSAQESKIALESPIQVQFSQPMDQAATAEAFALKLGEATVAGEVAWSEDGTLLSFQPAENLQIDSTYRVVIDAAGARGLGGASIREGRDFSFQTVPLPYVDSTSPQNGESGVLPGLQMTTIFFGTPMNTDTLEDKILIFPEPEEWLPVVHSQRSLGIQFEFLPNMQYTITLLAGAEDVYGNAISSDYTYSFSVGDFPPEARLLQQGRFMITGAYRQDTAVPMYIVGKPEVDFELYSVERQDVDLAFRSLYGDQLDRLRKQENLLRSWTAVLDGGSTFANVKVALLEEGGALPPGNYLLIAYYAYSPDNVSTMPLAFAVTDSTVTYKRMEDQVMVWVTDMQTGEPMPNQTVTVYALEEAYARGTTDENGVLFLDVTLPVNDSDITIISESEGHYGMWYSYSAPNPQDFSLYAYTDRPLYRPGETVYYRGAYRVKDDTRYSVDNPDDLRYRVIFGYSGESFLEGQISLTDFGTFSGEFQLPDDAPIGPISIEFYRNDLWLGVAGGQIAEFRVPEFSVSVTPVQDEIIRGESLQALVQGTFFSGGVVSNAPLTWNLYSNETSFNYTGEGRYSFTDIPNFFYYSDYGYNPYGQGGSLYSSGEGITNSEGQFLIEANETSYEGTRPQNVVVEAVLSDESGQFIAGRSNVLVHPSEVYVGTRTTQYFAQAGDPFTAEFITVTPESEVIPEQNITVTLLERRWQRVEVPGQFGRYEWEQEEIEVESLTLTTGEDGRISHDFVPPNAGRFIVRAESFDQLERFHRSEVTVWVRGEQVVFWGGPESSIDLIADKDGYVEGDTAEIFIPISAPGTSYVLVSVERQNVMAYEVVQVEGSSLVYELPITAMHEPTIYVSAVVITGINEENSYPTYRQGNVALQVEPINKRLDLTVTPSDSNTQPGETVTLDIEARDPDGNPVQAELGLSLVDAAILSLAQDQSPTPESFYYGYAGLETYTETALQSLLDEVLDELFGAEPPSGADEMEAQSLRESDGVLAAAPTAMADMAMGGGGGGGGGFEEVTVRQDFQQTPLWAPHVVTDENGQAQVSVTMPDNLTIWHLTARGLTTDTLVSQVETDIASTLPLLVRPVTPRFFTVGDVVTLAMVVNNNTDRDQLIRTTMQGTGFELLEGESLEQEVLVPRDGRVRVEWRVRIPDVDFVDLTFIALGEDGAQDAAKPALATGPDGTIPVYAYTAPDTTGTGGVLREGGSRTEGISLPPFVDSDQGELTVRVDPSLAATTLETLDYMELYSFESAESIASKLLTNAMTWQALDLENDPDLRDQLRIRILEALDRLTETQNPDGGWGWFGTMESDPLVTAHVVLSLFTAADAGFVFEEGMLDRGVSFMRSDLINPTEDTNPWRLNRQAFYFYVLSRDARYAPSAGELDALYTVRLEMSLYAKAFLLMSYQSANAAALDQLAALTSDLISAAKLSATGAHWEEDWHDWYNWGSDTRSTAIVLDALLKVDPNNELLPNAVRWLMVARKGDHWESSQENAWALRALVDWMSVTNELQGDYDFALLLNGAEALSSSVTPEDVDLQRELEVAVQGLLLDELNRLTITRSEGTGNLYYTAHLQLRLDAAQVEATDRGVHVTREYFIAGNSSPVTEANMGDVISVRVTITVPEDIYYFVLSDPLPAGTEPLDTSLLTTSRAVEGPQLRAERDPEFWWWWWIWDHTEIRDEQVNLYADYLSAGTYVYTYQVQATVPGEFQTMPSHAYATYFPEVFGRSDGLLFTVHDSTDDSSSSTPEATAEPAATAEPTAEAED